jgi:hypothetical protein
MTRQFTYVCGPISGYPQDNRPAFERAAEILKAEGHKAITPFEVAPNPTSYEEAMRLDVAFLAEHCGRIAVLPGWQNSRGAKCELHAAQMFGMRPLYLTASDDRNRVLARIEQAETAALAAMPALTAENFAEQARADAEREARPRRWWQLWRSA